MKEEKSRPKRFSFVYRPPPRETVVASDAPRLEIRLRTQREPDGTLLAPVGSAAAAEFVPDYQTLDHALREPAHNNSVENSVGV